MIFFLQRILIFINIQICKIMVFLFVFYKIFSSFFLNFVRFLSIGLNIYITGKKNIIKYLKCPSECYWIAFKSGSSFNYSIRFSHCLPKHLLWSIRLSKAKRFGNIWHCFNKI